MQRAQSDLETESAYRVWDTKYRYRDGARVVDATVADTWRRVAQALASVEPCERTAWERRFLRILEGFRFIPGGRILAGAGTARRVTLFNCFVMASIEDSLAGIFHALREGALTLQQGGGVGYDFSTLRPSGAPARATAGIASGPVSFMHIFDSMCSTLLSGGGSRRGAMMATLRCDHPDIEAFIEAKRTPGALANFNLSVLVSDDFMRAVRGGERWSLVFPLAAGEEPARGDGAIIHRRWSGADRPIPCRVLREVEARRLWERIMRAAHAGSEPGVLFVDTINRENNLWYRESISATNPCGEIPLPAYGACDLGSINLTRFVRDPFEATARLDTGAIARTAAVAVRLLDDVIDLSRFPLDPQREQARGARRIGLGITGLADALLMLGLRYDSEAAQAVAIGVMRRLRDAAYRTSIRLAAEKGPFPYYEEEKYLAGAYVRRLPGSIVDLIARHGIRNSHLLAIAPTGSISLLAGNVSSGIEPVFADRFERRLIDREGNVSTVLVEDYACRLWRTKGDRADRPPHAVFAEDIPPAGQLRMQAALQPAVDNAISKTVIVPRDMPFGELASLYEDAHALGLKGCTVFRPSALRGEVLARTRECPCPPDVG
jgi:ribonucleoside-diphosphate reductase alpha chain